MHYYNRIKRTIALFSCSSFIIYCMLLLFLLFLFMYTKRAHSSRQWRRQENRTMEAFRFFEH